MNLAKRDDVAVFLRRSYPALHAADRARARSLKNPKLKFILFQDIVRYAVKSELNVVLSNAHAERKVRAAVIRIARANQAKVVMVWMNPSRSLLLSRIRRAHKSTRVLNESKNFEECLSRQETLFEEPSTREADHFFEIRGTKDIPGILKRIEALVAD